MEVKKHVDEENEAFNIHYECHIQTVCPQALLKQFYEKVYLEDKDGCEDPSKIAKSLFPEVIPRVFKPLQNWVNKYPLGAVEILNDMTQNKNKYRYRNFPMTKFSQKVIETIKIKCAGYTEISPGNLVSPDDQSADGEIEEVKEEDENAIVPSEPEEEKDLIPNEDELKYHITRADLGRNQKTDIIGVGRVNFSECSKIIRDIKYKYEIGSELMKIDKNKVENFFMVWGNQQAKDYLAKHDTKVEIARANQTFEWNNNESFHPNVDDEKRIFIFKPYADTEPCRHLCMGSGRGNCAGVSASARNFGLLPQFHRYLSSYKYHRNKKRRLN